MTRNIGTCDFTDGSTRDVWEEDDGRQFVVDEGQAVYGVWILADEPAVVHGDVVRS